MEYNQMHEVKNVFITDGSCMTSSAWQNPSLTYMALTARACDFAVNELKKGTCRLLFEWNHYHLVIFLGCYLFYWHIAYYHILSKIGLSQVFINVSEQF